MSKSPSPIRVLLADDHAILRSGVRLLIDEQDDLRVVAEAGDGAEALERARETRPDVVVLDLSMPGRGGLDVLEQLRREVPECRVLVLSMHDGSAHLRAAITAGAAGYVVKAAADTELLSALRAVAEGRFHIGPTFRDLEPEPTSRASHSSGQEPTPSPELLSPRERQVLELVALGFTHREIAERIHLSIKTVETYRARLGEKLDLKSRAQLVRYALDAGILDAG